MTFPPATSSTRSQTLFGCIKRKKQELKRANIIDILQKEHNLDLRPGKKFDATVMSNGNITVSIAPGRDTERVSGNDFYNIEKAIEAGYPGTFRLTLNG